MKDFVCLYSVEVLDLNDKVKPCYGVLFADSFTDAVGQLENSLYGNDLVKINEIELLDSIFEVPAEIYTLIKKELKDER